MPCPAAIAPVAVMLGLIRLAVDPALQPLDEPAVTVTFRDRARRERVVPRATGSAERPMRPEAVAAKFEALAGLALGPEAVAALREAADRLDALPDCAVLDGLLAGDAPAGPVFR